MADFVWETNVVVRSAIGYVAIDKNGRIRHETFAHSTKECQRKTLWMGRALFRDWKGARRAGLRIKKARLSLYSEPVL